MVIVKIRNKLIEERDKKTAIVRVSTVRMYGGSKNQEYYNREKRLKKAMVSLLSAITCSFYAVPFAYLKEKFLL